MKQQSVFNTVKDLLTRAVFSLILIMTTNSLSAQVMGDKDSLAISIQVNYLGNEDDMMLISVSYLNPDASRLNLSIYSTGGEILFRDTYIMKQFNKKFKVPKEHGKLNVVLTGAEDKISRSFDVFEVVRTPGDVLVTR